MPSQSNVPGRVLLALAAGLLTAGCRGSDGSSAPATAASQGTQPGKGAPAMSLTLTSQAFQEGQPIPRRHTGEGEDLSPPLAWSSVPKEAQELAMIVDDPDAPGGDWVHWVLYKVPPTAAALKEGLPRSEKLTEPPGAVQGRNSWPSGNIGYRGPMPPPGKPHHYVFKLYALDAKLDLKAGAGKQELLKAIAGHVLAEGRLTGTYKR